VNHALVAIFEVDADGKISKWREYFDTKDVERQLTAAAVKVPRVAKERT
jgi:limonene-1,2-epoxide hydrolase